MALSIAQEAKQVRDGWWKWSVWLEGSRDELNEVSAVEWMLHPTFPSPLQRVKNREHAFRLESAGWGEFTISATIFRRKGTPLKRRHWLKLEAAPGAAGSDVATSARRRRTGKGLAEESPAEEAPLIFVSSSVADAQYAHEIAEQLSEQGLRTFTAEDVRPGDRSFKQSELVNGTHGSVVVMSGSFTRGMAREVAALREGNVPIIPVLIGPEAKVPGDLAGVQQLRIKGGSSNEVADAAQRIATRVRDLLAK